MLSVMWRRLCAAARDAKSFYGQHEQDRMCLILVCALNITGIECRVLQYGFTKIGCRTSVLAPYIQGFAMRVKLGSL